MLQKVRNLGQTGLTVYPSAFDAHSPLTTSLANIDLIYALRQYGFDQATLNSDRMWDWVAAGGTLVVEM